MTQAGRKPGGPKTGGRQKGTPNKRTTELRERVAERLGPEWCPVVAMAELAEARDLPLDLRLKALAEVAPYLHAKRKPAADIEEAADLAERIAEARVRAMRTGGITLERLVVLSAVPEADPSLSPHPEPMRVAPAATPEPHPVRAAVAPPAPRLPPVSNALSEAAARLSDNEGQAVTDYDPLTRPN